ncbi:MAG: DUF6345 domain-containing protein [Chloroflexaceae bacterium]|nr:DUF6345 domain-containing protein [Chloroflexaceae bacterium]
MSARPSRPPLRLALMTLVLSLVLTGAWTARSATPVFVTANNIVLQQGEVLPIFPLSAPQVNSNTTRELARRFSGFAAGPTIAPDTYLGLPRFTVPLTDTSSLLVRYGATGGYYATNLNELGRESARGAIDRTQAQQLACLFLLTNGFMDARGRLLLDQQNLQGVLTPNPQGCGFNPDPQNPLYATSLIRAATVPANNPGGAPTEQDVGVVVRVPMNLPVQFGQRSELPLGGPGGHLSLLFTTTTRDNGPTLDDAVPGLAGVAMPFFSRQLGQPRNVPIANPDEIRNQVEQQVRASFPGATAVNVPQPVFSYYVLDAAVEQRALEPVLEFQGIEVTIGGETVILRDIVAPLARPGAGGFGPTVSITDPASGSPFNPGAEVLLRGAINDGAAPYRVEWLTGDGVALGSSTVNGPGAVELRTRSLPVTSRGGTPTAVTVVLRVTDNEGAVREARVILRPAVAPVAYLPLVIRDRSGAPATTEAILEQVGYGFGIEANWDYPPAGPGGGDLPGVVPDANGLRSGMLGYGYSQRFYWTNSNAWERDWRDCGLGGIDCTLGVDRADFVYYAGHGGPAGLSLASNIDSTWASANNARFNSARWVGFASCQTLRVQGYAIGSEPIRRWFGSFQGAHMLLGFNSNMADVAFGGRLVENMRMPSFFGIDFPWAQPTIAQAWIKTSFELNAGKIAYVYARGGTANPATDRLPKPGQPMPPRPLPVSSYHWVWETF